jgi:hypothetical protein
MTSNDTQKSLQTFPSALNDFIREPVGEDFARERRDIDARGFTLKYVAESFKVRVPPADEGVTQFKGRNIRLRSQRVDD